MNFLPVVLISGVTVLLSYITVRKIFPELVRKKAIKQLENILFPEGYWQKSEVVRTFRKLTDERFSDEDILDYFFKIKGLQTIDINAETNFWLKRYLFSPTSIKLNYFEQVKFYETFLNYPAPGRGNNQTLYHQSVNTNKEQVITTQKHAARMSRNPI
ncbi:hypothetical protein [Anaerophaga thermohalophila]|jgi:hypothetical protein|uniref:hypothetical protein n=1 Tax=Anaerophaga thermohalophila TaxID=177400 RepID=UPI0002DECE71|nr:hypothetical protein [Anaerophaga thermohalophila]